MILTTASRFFRFECPTFHQRGNWLSTNQFLTAIKEINYLVQTVDQEVGGSSPPSCTTTKSIIYGRSQRLTKKPVGTHSVRWSILIVRAKAVWLGDVEAASEAEAIAKGAEEFKQPKERLMAVRR